MRLAFHEYCFQVWKMKQNPKLFSSESWFINTCITLLILFNITIAPQASFAEEDQMPQVAPHLIPGYRSYYAEDSIQLQDMAYQNQPSGSLPVSKKPSCTATLTQSAGSVFARCGTRPKAGKKSSKGRTIFGGKAFPDYDYLKNYIKFGDLEKTPGTQASKGSEP